MLPVFHFNDKKSLAKFVGNDEISQKNNPNAYSRLFITEDGQSVVKLYDGFWRSGAENNRPWVEFSGPAGKNIENIYLLSERLTHDQYPQIALPNAMISFCGQVVGYMMPYVDGIEMGAALKDSRFTHNQKVDWFNQLAEIILSLPKDVFVGDLHAQNVLIRKDGIVMLIDIDGFSIVSGHQLTCPAMHNENLPAKYFNDLGDIIISRETDILCLFRMFFKYIFDGKDIIYFPEEWIKQFPRYLQLRGMDINFISSVTNLFSFEINLLYPRLFSQWHDICLESEYGYFIEAIKANTAEAVARRYLNNLINEEIEYG